MKTKLFLITVLLVCGLVGGCRNPWMERVLINLYHIGDRGPGGGIIFYRSEKGFTDTYSGKTHHFLEAAPITQLPALWGTMGVDIPTKPGIGSGRYNTNLIISMEGSDAASTAAWVCRTYHYGGKDDWFLPSIAELTEFASLFPSTLTYWSSEQIDDIQAISIKLEDITINQNPKTTTNYIYPIRAF